MWARDEVRVEWGDVKFGGEKLFRFLSSILVVVKQIQFQVSNIN
jgi:hypothetical protein